MIKIVITGPESTGKTHLSERLAEAYRATLVPEYARLYLTDLKRAYKRSDLDRIAQGQMKAEQDALKSDAQMVICDTGMLVIKIWSLYKYGELSPYLRKQAEVYSADLFLLLDADFPYEPDPLRENEKDRQALFDLYEKELRANGCDYRIITGNGDERYHQAKKIIDQLLKNMDAGVLAP